MALFGSRIANAQTARKPTVLLNKQMFPFIEGLKAGDKGQLDVVLFSVGSKLEEQQDGIEKPIETLEILDAIPVISKVRRIV